MCNLNLLFVSVEQGKSLVSVQTEGRLMILFVGHRSLLTYQESVEAIESNGFVLRDECVAS